MYSRQCCRPWRILLASAVRPDSAAVADVRQLELAPRWFRTRFGGLFLFLPTLAQIPLDKLLKEAGFPGSQRRA